MKFSCAVAEPTVHHFGRIDRLAHTILGQYKYHGFGFIRAITSGHEIGGGHMLGNIFRGAPFDAHAVTNDCQHAFEFFGKAYPVAFVRRLEGFNRLNVHILSVLSVTSGNRPVGCNSLLRVQYDLLEQLCQYII